MWFSCGRAFVHAVRVHMGCMTHKLPSVTTQHTCVGVRQKEKDLSFRLLSVYCRDGTPTGNTTAQHITNVVDPQNNWRGYIAPAPTEETTFPSITRKDSMVPYQYSLLFSCLLITMWFSCGRAFVHMPYVYIWDVWHHKLPSMTTQHTCIGVRKKEKDPTLIFMGKDVSIQK